MKIEDDFGFDVLDRTGICDCCGKQSQITETILDDAPNEALCYECCEEQGFCAGCGCFASGTSEYDFSEMGAYCANCQDEIRDAEHDDDLDYFEDDY